MTEKRLFNIEELTQYLSIPKATLYTWTHQKKIPFIKIGRSIRFDKAEIDEWVNLRRVCGQASQNPAQECKQSAH